MMPQKSSVPVKFVTDIFLEIFFRELDVMAL